MSLSDALSLISLVITMILGILAIWITFHFKGEADKVNQETRSILIDVKTDAKALTQVAQGAMSELQEYGKASRALMLGRVPEMQLGATQVPEQQADASHQTVHETTAMKEESTSTQQTERGDEK